MYSEQLRQEAEAYVEEVWDGVLTDIDRLVSIESVEDLPHAAPGSPWGPNVARTLERALDIAERLGLAPTNLDGYIGWADVPGQDDKVVATICHSDVVPLGEGWSVDPLCVTSHEGFIMGRGVLDDKGPLVLSLYAAAFFARKAAAGDVLPHTLRAIVGANEETGMGDVPKYLEVCGEPDFLFSPDAAFPLICGEKGIFQGAFTSGLTEPGESALVSVTGGTAPNAIPGSASATVMVDASSLPPAANVTVSPAGAGLARIDAHGRGGHASMPEGTRNAIGTLAGYLLATVRLSDEQRQFLRLVRLVAGDATDGSTAGVACANDNFGPLTLIGGTIRCEGGRLVQTVDSRYPDVTTGDALADAFRRLAGEHGATFKVLSNMEPFYVDPKSAPIQALLASYEEYTGDLAEPLVIGGGTYARHFERACAFGPIDPNERLPHWAGAEHGPDEAVSEATLKQALKIYISAIARLMDLEL